MAKSLLELGIRDDVRREAKALQDTLLNTLGWNGIRKLEQFATVNAARAVAPDVRNAAPGGPRGLMGRYVRGRRSRMYSPGAVVGPVAGKKGAWWAKFVVYGTKPHSIPKFTAGNVFFNGRWASKVDHPGAKGNNFIGPTVDRNMEKVRDAFAGTIGLLVRDEAMRNRVLGFSLQYKNQSAANWQQSPYGRHYKNAEYLEPFSAAVREKPAGQGGRRTAEQENRVNATGRIRDVYKASASGTIGVVPRINLRRP